jgi:hypothetical protein
MDFPEIYIDINKDFDSFDSFDYFDFEPFYSDSSLASITSTPSLDGWSSAQSPEMSAQEWPAQATGEEEMLLSFVRVEV